MLAASIIFGFGLDAALVYLLGDVWTSAVLLRTAGLVILLCCALDGGARIAAWLAGRFLGERAGAVLRTCYECVVLSVIAFVASFVATRPASLAKPSTIAWLVVSVVVIAALRGGARLSAWWARGVPGAFLNAALGVAVVAIPVGAWEARNVLSFGGSTYGSSHEDSGYCRAPGGAPVAVIGLDGATWTVMQPLIDRGDLPNLGRLVREGAWGVLRADAAVVNPVANSATMGMRSPVLWETMATGVSPREHGMWDFEGSVLPWTGDVLPLSLPLLEHVLLNRTDAHRARFYEAASRCGRRVAAVGWYSSWPAVSLEEGVVVSDLAHINLRFTTLEDAQGAHAAGRLSNADYLGLVRGGAGAAESAVSPASLIDRCRLRQTSLEDDGGDVDVDVLRRLTTRIATELAGLDDAALRTSLERRLLVPLRRAHARDRFYQHAAVCLGADGRDLVTVYYRLPDETQHLFWGFWDGGDVVPGARSLAEVIPTAYRLVDAYVGELLALLPSDARVLVISDHGFGPWDLHGLAAAFPRNARPDYSGQHRPDGIIIVHGPGVVPGPIRGARTQDAIAPTVAWLLGMAAPAGSQGEALIDLFDQATASRLGALVRAPWPSVAPGAMVRADSATNERVRQQLRALGYVQ